MQYIPNSDLGVTIIYVTEEAEAGYEHLPIIAWEAGADGKMTPVTYRPLPHHYGIHDNSRGKVHLYDQGVFPIRITSMSRADALQELRKRNAYEI
jgi:hypothetical protein